MTFDEAEKMVIANKHWKGYNYHGKIIADIITIAGPVSDNYIKAFALAYSKGKNTSPTMYNQEYLPIVLFDLQYWLSHQYLSLEWLPLTQFLAQVSET